VASPPCWCSRFCKRFGAVRCLVDVDLKIRAGEVVALVGEERRPEDDAGQVISGSSRRQAASLAGPAGPAPAPARRPAWASPPSTRNLAMCGNLDVVGTLPRREIHRAGLLTKSRWSATPRPAERAVPRRPRRTRPGSDLSGGQRQTVAIPVPARQTQTPAVDEPTRRWASTSQRLLDLIRSCATAAGVLLISPTWRHQRRSRTVRCCRLGEQRFFDVNTTPQETDPRRP